MKITSNHIRNILFFWYIVTKVLDMKTKERDFKSTVEKQFRSRVDKDRIIYSILSKMYKTAC